MTEAHHMTEAQQLTIPDHIHGYPDIAFGGYVAGLLAAHSPADTVRVDFRRALHVGKPVHLIESGGDRVALAAPDGSVLVEASPSTLAITPPPAPSWSVAKTATETALTSPKRQVTDCYGCGIACPPGRGLRLFPWSTPDHDLIAAAWTPDPNLADANGELPAEVVWSALDCPGGIAAWVQSDMGQGAFTAALTATQLRPVLAGAEHISHAWAIHRDGRKHTVGVALSTADGELCALAEALWIEPKGA
ncbi:PaaI family thioesterase [Nocardia sp. NPDC127526]|uniref:PaaI family thioesterase n=1 Tax=Nocardia sp. NPDC127526 TaxID=3345393 RepID=UPI003626CD93